MLGEQSYQIKNFKYLKNHLEFLTVKSVQNSYSASVNYEMETWS